jgi:hypothetical protein
VGERKPGRIMQIDESVYVQTSTRQNSGDRGLCVYIWLTGNWLLKGCTTLELCRRTVHRKKEWLTVPQLQSLLGKD